MKKSKVFLLAVVMLSLMRFSCGDEPGVELKIQIYCTAADIADATFWGTYTIDGEIKTITPGQFGTNSYLFEKEITVEDLLEISVTKDDASANLQIRIYDDGDKIKEATLGSYEPDSDDPGYSLNLEYEIPDEDDTSSSN